MEKHQLKIVPTNLVTTMTNTEKSVWDRAKASDRTAALNSKRLVDLVLVENQKGVSIKTASKNLYHDIVDGLIAEDVAQTAKLLAKGKKVSPSYATIERWVGKFLKDGLEGLLPKHIGSARKEYGWETRAMHLKGLPSKLDDAAIARMLREEGFTTAQEHRVRSFLKSLPANFSENSRSRLGPKAYRDSTKTYVRRDTDVLPVGHVYQGDGHTIDTYIAHPSTGKIWRPELTVWIDVRSRYIVGWWISNSESALSTLFALSHAMLTWDHAPPMLHIDNGSGFKSKMVNDDSTGFYARFSMQPMFSIPGNPKGKGQIERWFRTMEGQFGKRWPSYCGKDMAPDVLNKLARDVNRGKYKLPSLAQYTDALAVWIEGYNNEVHSSLDGQTPAQLWATLERIPLHTPAAAVCWPQKLCSVRRQTITLDKREYMAPELIGYNGREKLTVEYSVHDDSYVRVLDPDGRWICDAKLVMKKAYLPASRIVESGQRALVDKKKRLQKEVDEAEQRARISITHDQTLDDIELLNESLTQPLEEQEPNHLEPSFDINEIDILDTDY